MAVKFKIKKGDQVVVTTGREKGKTGEVVEVRPSESRVLLAHVRASQSGPGGIQQKEAPLHISNVAHVDPASQLVLAQISRMELKSICTPFWQGNRLIEEAEMKTRLEEHYSTAVRPAMMENSFKIVINMKVSATPSR